MSIDPAVFTVQEKGDLRLIIPNHTAGLANSSWHKNNLQYRSRVETLDGKTVSQGFKKFFNLGMGSKGLQVTPEDVVKAVENGDAWATLKVDGSLLIRSEWNEKLMLRTRGSFGYEHLDNAVEMNLFFQKYPKLFELGNFPQFSLLFEWVSPQNVIVLKYPEPELTLIGGINHYTLGYLSLPLLYEVATYFETPLVKHFKLDSKGWSDLNAALDTSQDIEGYVIRLDKEQTLVKVKCAPYLTKHALKSTLSSEKLADMYFQQGRPDFKTFCDQFIASFDEEILMWALGAISSMYDGVKHLNAIEAHMTKKAKERQGMTRKEAALTGIAEYGQTKRFSAYMNLWEGKTVDTNLLKSILLQNTKQVEIGMFTKPDII